jgi:hypothetical protein
MLIYGRMGDIENRQLFNEQREFLDPYHFYAAYVFDRVNEHQADVQTLIEQSQELGYPVRYWWLSEALDLQDSPDRLIVCVHHPSRSADAGLDLYENLKEEEVTWDDLDAAALEEYVQLGKPVVKVDDLRLPDGRMLYPDAILGERAHAHDWQATALFIISVDAVREASQERLGRDLTGEEFAAILVKFQKNLDWLDWTIYLDEAIDHFLKTGSIRQASEDSLGSEPEFVD